MADSSLPPLPQGLPPIADSSVLPIPPPPSPVDPQNHSSLPINEDISMVIEDAQNADMIRLLGLFRDKMQKMLSSKITPINIALAAAYAMEIVERSKLGKGSSKKHLVINLLEEYVRTADLTEEDKLPLLLLIETTVPGLIDTAADIANGKFKINLKSWCCCS